MYGALRSAPVRFLEGATPDVLSPPYRARVSCVHARGRRRPQARVEDPIGGAG